MALTVQVNGSTVGGVKNTIMASWFNDYHDLLTGAMSDQPVTLKTGVTIQAIGGAPGTGPTLALAAGTTLGIGVYKYVVTFVDGSSGETVQGPSTTITTTSGNQAINLSAIPTGPTGVTERKIYRTAVGGSTYLLVVKIFDNTTTTYADTIADASLQAFSPPASSSLGALFIKDNAGTLQATLYNNGSLAINGLASSGGFYLARLRAKGSGVTPGQAIWIAPTGQDPTTGDGLVEGDIVFSF